MGLVGYIDDEGLIELKNEEDKEADEIHVMREVEQVAVSSPFGEWMFDTKDKHVIADVLITVAGQIRRDA